MPVEPTLDDVIEFVREYARLAQSTTLSGTTRIDADLGITGDDGAELLAAAEERFAADFGDDLTVAFGLDPDQVLFGDEGFPIPGAAWLGRLTRGTKKPKVRDLTIAELYDAVLRCPMRGPGSPFLVVRPEVAFWVVQESFSRVRATLQAFRAGCYDGVDCIDAEGGLWPVVQASLREAPSAISWARPAKRLRVKLRFGPRQEAGLPGTVESLVGILRSDSDFTDHLKTPATVLIAQLAACASISEVIEVVQRGAS